MKPLFLALALGACAPAVGSNYTLPAQCRGDLSHVDVPIVKVAPAVLARYNKKSTPQIGAYVYPTVEYPKGLILVDATLGAGDAATVVRHERCHHIAGNWHP